MEGLVFALFVLKNRYQQQRSVQVVPEPEFQPFNLAALRLPKEVEANTRDAKSNRRPALAVPAAC